LVVGADGRDSVVRDCSGLAIEDIGAPVDALWMRLPQVERGVAGALLGQEVEEIPLWHERHEAALRSQIRHVTQHNMLAADASADLSDLLVRPFQKLFEQTEFVHDLKCRGMHRIAPEVAQEIGMLLQNQDFDSGPRQQKAQHYPGGTAAGDATGGLQFLW
jgi:hypothetical protein